MHFRKILHSGGAGSRYDACSPYILSQAKVAARAQSVGLAVFGVASIFDSAGAVGKLRAGRPVEVTTARSGAIAQQGNQAEDLVSV
jgi:hypothetical protein